MICQVWENLLESIKKYEAKHPQTIENYLSSPEYSGMTESQQEFIQDLLERLMDAENLVYGGRT